MPVLKDEVTRRAIEAVQLLGKHVPVKAGIALHKSNSEQEIAREAQRLPTRIDTSVAQGPAVVLGRT